MPIPIYLAVEDELSERVARRLLEDADRDYHAGSCYRKGGFGYLKSKIHKFNQAARSCPWLVLTDLDNATCPPGLISAWIPNRHPNLMLRVAVREVEAWLLADRSGFAAFAQIQENAIPTDVEGLPDPKATLLNLIQRSVNRGVREDMLPRVGSTSKVGPNYNGRLGRFVLELWSPSRAAPLAPSLEAAISALQSFVPS